LEFN